MTFGEVATIHLRNLEDNLSLKPRTRDYWRECLAALEKSWPGLNETQVRRITQTGCREWARAYAKAASPTRFNNTAAVFRHVLGVAVEGGVIYSNPGAIVKRVAVRSKEIALPSVGKFNALMITSPICHWKRRVRRFHPATPESVGQSARPVAAMPCLWSGGPVMISLVAPRCTPRHPGNAYRCTWTPDYRFGSRDETESTGAQGSHHEFQPTKQDGPNQQE